MPDCGRYYHIVILHRQEGKVLRGEGACPSTTAGRGGGQEEHPGSLGESSSQVNLLFATFLRHTGK